MKASRFVSIAVPERQRFATLQHLLGFCFMALLALLAVFPAQSLLRSLESSTRVDPVSMAYLHAWLHAKPDDYALRLVLARHQMQAGDFPGGEKTLLPMLAAAPVDAEEHVAAEFLLLDIRERELWTMPVGDPARGEQRLAYLGQLRRVAAYTQDRKRLEQFANTAFALEDSRLGRELYARMISDDPRASFGLLDRLVMMDTSEGNYRHAAAVYFNILPYTTDVDQRRRFFLAGLHVLRSGNLLNEAILAGESYAGPLSEDPQTLTYRVNLALANGRTDVAALLAARLLRQRLEPGKSA